VISQVTSPIEIIAKQPRKVAMGMLTPAYIEIPVVKTPIKKITNLDKESEKSIKYGTLSEELDLSESVFFSVGAGLFSLLISSVPHQIAMQ
jgi:hypothetical protein